MIRSENVARPNLCGRCWKVLVHVPARNERWDAEDRKWVGFLDCPRCGASYVFIRDGKHPSKREQRDGKTGAA